MSTHRKQLAVAALCLTAVGASFGAGVIVGGRESSAADPSDSRAVAATSPLHVSAANTRLKGALTSADSCDQLLDWYVERGVEQVGPYGWNGGGGGYFANASGAQDLAAMPQSSAPTASDTGLQRATASATGTNVQEAGVDEPDTVKTDGKLLVRWDANRLTAYDVSGPTVELSGSVSVTRFQDASLLLVGDRVLIIGTDKTSAYARPATRIVTVDVSDATDPQIIDEKVLRSDLVTAVQHGDVVRLILSAGLPDLDFVEPRAWRGERTALKRNQEVVRRSTIDDWLPTVTTFAGDKESTDRLLSCEAVALPTTEGGLGTMSVVAFDPAEPDTWRASGVLTQSQIAYASADKLVLADSGWGWNCCMDFVIGGGVGPEAGTTQLDVFALDGLETTYLASGQVDGYLRDRWSLDEQDGILRVAVGPSNKTGNFNSILTLSIDGDVLATRGRVDELGPGEEIKSVRWFGDTAIVVTFRQIDPLYVVDLSNADAPRLRGALKIPGFSDYLHPLGPERLIGVGQDATRRGILRGAQAALFNLADLTNPRQVALHHYDRGTTALAGEDPRQFMWLPERRTALTVITDGYGARTGWVSVLHLNHGEFEQRLVEVEYGDDVAQVRLVPLPSGKVVLVTGDGVDFFAV